MKNSYLVKFLCVLFIGISCLAHAQDVSKIRELIFKETNALRVAKGLPKLHRNDSLMNLAQWHSENMVRYDFYDHIDHKTRGPVERAEERGVTAWRREGNRFIGISENIGMVPWFENVAGCGDTRSEEVFAQCMVNGWKKSKPHYKNIMDKKSTFLGIGLVFDKDGKGFATQNFR